MLTGRGEYRGAEVVSVSAGGFFVEVRYIGDTGEQRSIPRTWVTNVWMKSSTLPPGDR